MLISLPIFMWDISPILSVKKTRILLTNDDGVNSPSLVPTIESILRLQDPPYGLDISLEVIVPADEQSWISKKISIRDTIKIDKNYKVDGFTVTTLTGTPSDCVNYGIYKSDKKPQLVISGMNVGSNTSLGHFFSSGTVGGAIEGVIAGVRAIAVSAPYANEPRTPENFGKALAIFPKLVHRFIESPPTSIHLLSVNIPLTRSSNYYFSSFLERKSYGRIFEEFEDGSLKHRYMRNLISPDELTRGSDRWARAFGIPTISAFDQSIVPVAPATLQKWLAKYNLNHVLNEQELESLL